MGDGTKQRGCWRDHCRFSSHLHAEFASLLWSAVLPGQDSCDTSHGGDSSNDETKLAKRAHDQLASLHVRSATVQGIVACPSSAEAFIRFLSMQLESHDSKKTPPGLILLSWRMAVGDALLLRPVPTQCSDGNTSYGIHPGKCTSPQ